MVGVNIGDFFTATPWSVEKIDEKLCECQASGLLSCDAVKFWHCDPAKVIPVASKQYIRKVVVHANNEEMLTVADWEEWVDEKLDPIVAVLRHAPVYKRLYLAVGNEALAPWNVERYGQALLPCLRKVRLALKRAGLLDRVGLITPLEMSVLADSYPPSACVVAEGQREVVAGIVRLLVKLGSPFCMNVYPFFAREHASEDFVLFGPDPGYEDGGRQYTNMFAAMYDATVHAISKLDIPGAAELEVVVTETGWPTAGDSMCDADSSQRFVQGVVQASRTGTPLRPGRLEVYLFELHDEENKEGAEHEKHFGIFQVDA